MRLRTVPMRTVAIIQARMGSTRLPGKVLAEVAGKPLLQHMIERLKWCESLDQIVVATPESASNIPIQALCHNLGIRWWAGSEEDVLGRVLEAANLYDAELIVELTADCPLIDPIIVERAVSEYLTSLAYEAKWPERHVDFVSTSRDSFPDPSVAYPRGMDVRVFPRAALEEIAKLTDDPADREHVSLYFWTHRYRYSCQNLEAPAHLRDDVRLTVDTPEDLELVRTIFEELYPAVHDFGLGHVLKLLQAAPELREINRHIEQKAAR